MLVNLSVTARLQNQERALCRFVVKSSPAQEDEQHSAYGDVTRTMDIGRLLSDIGRLLTPPWASYP